MPRRRVIIMGAGGRDFHTFNRIYRDDPSCEVVAFTVAQIPFLQGKRYPAALAGSLYPEGIPIHSEATLTDLIGTLQVEEVVFAYSDVSHEDVMHAGSAAISAGADFLLFGPGRTMLPCSVPVISVCAVRTGCGKSLITRKLARLLRAKGVRPAVVRHPMVYTDFSPWRRFASLADIDRSPCTIEEREEFEQHVSEGVTVYAGVEYREVLAAAQEDAQVIIWDGGNNDFPFVRSDLEIVLIDALRPGHERLFHPGEVNLRRADVLIISKVNEAPESAVTQIRENISMANPAAAVLLAPSRVSLTNSEALRGRKALVIEDGPTITHGGMAFGAGVAGSRGLVSGYVDPRPYAVGSIREIFEKFTHIGPVLPAMGYAASQIRELEETIARVPAEVIVIATPVDLGRVIRIDRPAVRATYDFDVDLDGLVVTFLQSHGL
jgi:predicted GTPase